MAPGNLLISMGLDGCQRRVLGWDGGHSDESEHSHNTGTIHVRDQQGRGAFLPGLQEEELGLADPCWLTVAAVPVQFCRVSGRYIEDSDFTSLLVLLK